MARITNHVVRTVVSLDGTATCAGDEWAASTRGILHRPAPRP